MPKPKSDLCKALEALNHGESHLAPLSKEKSIGSMCIRIWGKGGSTQKKQADGILVTRKPTSPPQDHPTP